MSDFLPLTIPTWLIGPLKSFLLKQKSEPVIWLIGYTSLLSVALLTGCNFLQTERPAAVPTPAITAAAPQPTATPRSLPTPQAPGTVVEPTVAGATESNSAGDRLPTPVVAAKIGQITFALETTEQHEPINPNLLFTTGITQVHAIFDYSGMSTAYTWERVWLLNDKEVSRQAGAWTGPESGVFDYFIDNGGRPLPAGDWVLEIYVEGKLLSLGAFVVEAPE